MLSFRSLRSLGAGLLAGGALAGAVVLGASPAWADLQSCNGQLQLTVSDPAPGAQPGFYTVQGTARDLSSTQGPGVGHVHLYLGDRDRGGQFLIRPPVDQSNGTWNASVDLSGPSGTRNVFVYAESQANRNVVWASIPITIGDATQSVNGPQVTATCQQDARNNVQLVIDNPQPGAMLRAASYQFSGSAADSTAQPGTSGIERVQVFSNDPNTGGRLLLSDGQVGPDGKWTATADLSGRLGSGILYVVARSSVNGAETTISLPAFFLP